MNKLWTAMLAALLIAALAIPAATAEDAPEAVETEIVFAAPVDEAVEEVEEADLWTEEIGNAAAAAEPVGIDASNEDDVPIDEAHFPSQAFREFIAAKFDSDGSGALSETEITAVQRINLQTRDYASISFGTLEGVQLFPNLEALSCSNRGITSLDISGCANLRDVHCSDNGIPSLDLSGCSALEDLDCSGNALTTLEVSGCTKLTYLDCSINQITHLDVSHNAALTYLECRENPLTNLDASGHTALTTLYCEDCQLASLNVAGDVALEHLACRDNLLTSLDIRGLSALVFLQCESNQMTSLDMTGCPSLIECARQTPELFGDIMQFTMTVGDTQIKLLADRITLTADGAQLYPVEEPVLEPIPLAGAKITGIKNQVYTGKPIKPDPVVKVDGVKLVKGTDYTVSYKNNKLVGLATVTIKGKGAYTGSVKKTFKISPKAVAISKLTAAKKQLTVQWKKSAGAGYQLQYGLKASFAGAKTVTITSTKTVRKVLKSLKSGKVYYVRIRGYKKVGGKIYASKWSKAKKAKVK